MHSIYETNFPAKYEPSILGQKERFFEVPNDYHVYVETLDVTELLQKFPKEANYEAYLRAIMTKEEPACTGVPRIGTPRWAEIILWLPGVDEHTLDELARQVPDVANYLSDDYRYCQTMLVWRASNDVEVRANEFVFSLANAVCSNDLGFGVTLINGTAVRYAAHHMSSDSVYSFACMLQVASASSGSNYKPFRVWGDEILEARKGLVEKPKPGIHITELMGLPNPLPVC